MWTNPVTRPRSRLGSRLWEVELAVGRVAGAHANQLMKSDQPTPAPRWRAGLPMCLAVLLLGAFMLGCQTADVDGDGGAGASAGAGDEPDKPKTPRTDEQERILRLLYKFRDEADWPLARDELIEMGPQAHQALFRFYGQLLQQEYNPRELRRLEREYAYALEQTKHYQGVLILAAFVVDRQGKRLPETTRASVRSILERARGATIIVPPPQGSDAAAEEKTIGEALTNAYTYMAGPLPAEPTRRDQLVTARINMIKMVAATGASEDGLELAEFYRQLEQLEGDGAWMWRARLLEAMEGFSGQASIELLELGVGDPDKNVRSIAHDVLERRRRLDRRRARANENK